MKVYKAVPGPKIVSVGKKQGDQDAVNLFAGIMNREASSGWEFHSMETITVQEKKGCGLNPQYINTSIYMLIFEKEQ